MTAQMPHSVLPGNMPFRISMHQQSQAHFKDRANNEPPLVLIIDDDHAIRTCLEMVFENEGVDSISAQHGAEALKHLEMTERLPNLIVLDLMMPVMNGWDFRAAQLDDPVLAAIPTLVLSATSEATGKIENLLVEDCLRKPVDLNILLKTVERMIPGWNLED